MSGIDMAKLTPAVPISGVGSGGRTASTGSQLGTKDAAQAGFGARTQGVSVEVGTRIEAGSPPIDSERVAEIRAALQDGSYPIVPTEIADALIAARLMMGYET